MEKLGGLLGTGYISPNLRVYRKFELARKFARSLKLDQLKNGLNFVECKVPNDIPQNPHRTYKKNFKSYEDF